MLLLDFFPLTIALSFSVWRLLLGSEAASSREGNERFPL